MLIFSISFTAFVTSAIAKELASSFFPFIFHYFVGFALHTKQFTSPNFQNV
jgi:hypothetical protein